MKRGKERVTEQRMGKRKREDDKKKRENVDKERMPIHIELYLSL